MSKEAMKLEMVDDEGENQAVRMFLALYGGACGVTAEQMRKHLKMAGFDGAWPEWANSHNGHLTKAGAQLWIRHLFALTELPAQPQPFEIEWPEYNEHAMGCSLEDIDVYCRYRAMRYGWDCAIEAVKQAIPDSIYTSPPAQRVGLTNKKIDSIQQEWIAKGMSGSRSFARAIEAAHGIKENT